MKTISITGPESSGKTTLAIGLSKLLKESFVKEYSRKYLNKKKKYTIKDLNIIAIKQLKKITEAESKTNNFLITDTSIIDIQIWSEIKYNKCSNKIISITKKECFDYYLLCKPDFPWVKDSLRENPDKRNEIFNAFINALNKKKANYTIIKGNPLNRLKSALSFIKKKL